MFQIDAGKTRLVKRLTYAGTLPLLLCAALAVVPVGGIDALWIALCYGAIIASFLCGIHWAVYLLLGDRCRRNLLITSNLIALAAWAVLLVPSRTGALGILGLCFLLLLKLDGELIRAEIYPAWYGRLRRQATIIVMLSLLVLCSRNFWQS